MFLNCGYKVVSGGTGNHLFLLDLVDKNLTSKEADAHWARAKHHRQRKQRAERSEEPVRTSGIPYRLSDGDSRCTKKTEVKELAAGCERAGLSWRRGH